MSARDKNLLRLVKRNLSNAKRQRTQMRKAFRRLKDKPGGNAYTSLNDYIARLRKSKRYLERKIKGYQA